MERKLQGVKMREIGDGIPATRRRKGRSEREGRRRRVSGSKAREREREEAEVCRVISCGQMRPVETKPKSVPL